jgi:hypothetical protein
MLDAGCWMLDAGCVGVCIGHGIGDSLRSFRKTFRPCG